jgi:hypothetical protein
MFVKKADGSLRLVVPMPERCVGGTRSGRDPDTANRLEGLED